MIRLKELRKDASLTQEQLSDRLGITRGAYANIENGRREPDFKTLCMLSNIFNVSIDYLLGNHSDGWGHIVFPDEDSDAYSSVCEMFLNLANIYGRDNISNEIRSTIPEPARLVELAQLFNYSVESFNQLLSSCILKSNAQDEAYPSNEFTQGELDLLFYYRQLNDEGKEKATEYVSDLVTLGRYKKHSVHEMDAKQA